MRIENRFRWLAWFGLLITSGTGDAAEHRYRLHLNPALDRISVEARLAGGISSLAARNGDSGSLDALAGCNDERLEVRRGRIRLNGDHDCVRYDYPLGGETSRRVTLADDVVVTSPSEWLWIPALGNDDRIHIDVDVPETVAVSVPWRPLGSHAFLLEPSPQSSRSLVVLGNFRKRTLRVPGAELRVALLDGAATRLNEAKILSWLDAAARDVAGVYGAFPNPNPQIIVIPSGPSRRGGSGSAVPFGHVIRDGGETVRFFVSNDKPLEDYLGDWTATHEFGHLLLPYIQSRQKWISEGFTSYYQNVLLARRGSLPSSHLVSR